MKRREFLQLGAWALLAAATHRLHRLGEAAEPEQTLTVPVIQVTGWAVPWRVNWMIGEQPIERQYLPLINK